MNAIPAVEDRERRLIEAVVALAKSFRDERDRLASRLTQLEREIDSLAIKLDQHQCESPGTVPPAEPPPDPSRTLS
jgi:hypothetical protein